MCRLTDKISFRYIFLYIALIVGKLWSIVIGMHQTVKSKGNADLQPMTKQRITDNEQSFVEERYVAQSIKGKRMLKKVSYELIKKGQ